MGEIEMNELKSFGALYGLKVLELGSTASGPFCGRLLADFGAEVTKIESPEGDPIRGLGHQLNGKSLYAASILRNKANVSINLKTLGGQALIRQLICQFDVLIENFRPGTLEKWGLGYEDLAKIHPGLVMVRISGYGQSGPYRNRPGYGVIGEAMSGLRDLIGEPDRPPSRVAMPLTDYIAALYAVIGTMMALRTRGINGEGQSVDVSLIESAFSFMESFVPAYAQKGVEETRAGARLPNSAPNTIFRCADGQYIHIAALADGVFRRLATAIDQPELAEHASFKTQAGRNAHESEVENIIQEWTGALTSQQVQSALERHDVPAAKVYKMKDIFEDTYFTSRNMLVNVPDEDFGSVTLTGVVPKLSKTPGAIRWAGKKLGADTASFLQAKLNLSPEQIAELAKAGIVYVND